MNVQFRRRRQALLAVFLLAFLVSLSSLGVTLFSGKFLTVIFGLISIIIALVHPVLGMTVVLFLVYFSVFPNLSLGPVQISVTTPAVVALAAASAVKLRSSKLVLWQLSLFILLGLAFVITTLTSSIVSVSLRLLPNLLMYVLILFSSSVLLKTKEDLIFVSRSMITFTLLTIGWQELLRPLGLELGIPMPTLGINGLVFLFHPALGIGLVTLFVPVAGFTGSWRGPAILALSLVILVSLMNETRAFWIAVLVTAVLFLILIRPKLSGMSIFIGISLLLIASTQFLGVFASNFERSLTSFSVFTGSLNQNRIDSSDYIRVLAFEAGKKMFLDQPLVGQGPNLFSRLKPLFADKSGRLVSGGAAGAFNSWMMILAEMGLLGLTWILFSFLAPLFILTRLLVDKHGREVDETFALALGLGLGVLSMGVHLLFIDLMYGTFVWINIGISMAAAQFIHSNTPKNERTTHRTGEKPLTA